MKNLLSCFRIIQLRYKLYIFAVLLFISLPWLIGGIVGCGKQAKLISSCGAQIAEQMAWLGNKDEICKKFDDACNRLKGNKSLKKSLMSFVEKAASRCNCKYELSNERRHRIDDVSISSVNAMLHNTSLPEFVHFSEAIIGDGIRISDVNFLAGKDGNLNIKCLVEAVLLGER
ncbi:MAG: hypothetical protein LBS87_03325 [Puniceicoccales bacterium]|jgi:hypothetical protein|nr:hypothetical protein [Puniceicoccales bacterium]